MLHINFGLLFSAVIIVWLIYGDLKKIGAIGAKLGMYIWGAAPPAIYKVSRPLQQIGLRILSFQTGSHFLQLGSKLKKTKNNAIEN